MKIQTVNQDDFNDFQQFIVEKSERNEKRKRDLKNKKQHHKK